MCALSLFGTPRTLLGLRACMRADGCLRVHVEAYACVCGSGVMYLFVLAVFTVVVWRSTRGTGLARMRVSGRMLARACEPSRVCAEVLCCISSPRCVGCGCLALYTRYWACAHAYEDACACM
jgi:hypothetical protein